MRGPRARAEVVGHDVVVVAPLDHEALLAALRVPGEGAVDEAEALERPALFDQRHNATGVEPPEAEDSDEHADGGAGPDRRVGRVQLHPPETEHLPAAEGPPRALERRRPPAGPAPGGWHRP